MSDNQSDNSVRWGTQAATPQTPIIETASPEIRASAAVLELAQQDVWMAEEQLQNARSALMIAQGRHELAKLNPRRHQVLCPGVNLNGQQLYTSACQLGYQFVLQCEKVHYVGKPGEGLINTGVSIEELPA